jgi:hypothetical protein
MTAVAMRPVAVAAPEYRRVLTSGVAAIAAVSAVMVLFGIAAFAMISPAVGAAWLLVAGSVAALDARFATATRLEVEGDTVTLGYWNRAKHYAAEDLVVTHDARRNVFSVARRGAHRTLARFRHEDGAARAFMGAGVEIVSH